MTRWPRWSHSDDLWLVRHIPASILTHPFEVLIGILCVLGGVPEISGHVTPKSVDSSLPVWARVVWGLMLLLGGGALIVGKFVRDREDRGYSHMERAGLQLVAPAALVYGVAILMSTHTAQAVTSGVLDVLFGLACYLRAYALGVVHRAIIRILESSE